MCAKFFKSTHILAKITIGMIGNKMANLLKYRKLYGKFISTSEIEHMLRRNIAATLLKMLCKNLYLVKCYNKTNQNVFALSLQENFSWGSTYFDKLIKGFLPNERLRVTVIPPSLVRVLSGAHTEKARAPKHVLSY